MKSKDDIWRYLKYYKQAFMPDKKRTPLSKYSMFDLTHEYDAVAFVKMVMDGRKSLLLKSATKTSLDFPKVSDLFVITFFIVRGPVS